MKRSLFLRNALFLCLPACLLLSGCDAAKQNAAFTPQLAESYDANVLLEYGEGQSASLTLSRCGDALWDVVFAEPPALAGVTLTFDHGAVTASYKGLAFSVPKTAMPAKNMLSLVTGALDAAAAAGPLPCSQRDNGTWCYSAECEGGTCTLTFSENGEPAAFEIPSQPLKLTFSDYTVTAAAETAQTESVSSTASASAADTTAASETAASDSCVTAETQSP